MAILALILAVTVLSYPFVGLATLIIVAGAGRCEFRFSRIARATLALGLVIEPGIMLALANAEFSYPWPESWVLAAWCAAGLGVIASLKHPQMLRAGKLNFLAVLTLAGISFCYVYYARRTGFVGLAIVPLSPFLSLTLLASRIWAGGGLKLNFPQKRPQSSQKKERKMNTQRFIAIAVIFAVASLGWMVLGGTIEYRTDQLEQSLSREVTTMWGPAGIVQSAPCVLSGDLDQLDQGQYDTPIQSDVDVSFEHHNRSKGLLWFSTYTVKFTGTYRLAAVKNDATFLFKLPDEVLSLQELAFKVDGRPVEPTYLTTRGASNTIMAPISAGDEQTVTVEYATRARDRWSYSSQWRPGERPGLLRNFTLTARTNFSDIDYPSGAVSPTKPAEQTETGMLATWRYQSMRASQTMGVEMPSRTNSGPIAARMSFFAPVSLAFFFTVLFTVVVLKKLPLHPMHYLFISAGFFAFHILMAYLVDLISIHAAFWICAAVSTALVVSYMRLVAGVKFAVLYAGAAQLVYLVGFSYAFFWVGATGLTLTIGAIATLFVLMQATGKVDWSEVFRRSPDKTDQTDKWETIPPLPNNPAASTSE